MARKTKEEAEKTRRKILGVALDVFSEKGFVRTTLNDIAAAAGFTRGAVYWHFKDKAALFVALAEDIEASTGISRDQLAKMPADSLEDYRTLILGFLEFLQKDQRYRKFYELAYFRTEWTEELAPVLERERRRTRRLVESARRDFEHFKKQGLVREEINPEVAAIAVNAFVAGLIELWLGDPELFSIEEMAPALVDQFLGAYQ